MIQFDAPIGTPRRATIDPLAVDAPGLLEYITRRSVMSIGRYDDIGQEEYGRAFTSAGTVGTDIATDLYEAFRDNIANKDGETAYAARVLPIIRAQGWLPELDDAAMGRRVALIFDTNLRVSRAAGKWANIQANKALLPYIQYRAVGDRRTRDAHRALDRVLLPVDHPFWNQHFPPCDFNCRCQGVALTRSQAARAGGVTADDDVRIAVERAGKTWDNVGMIAARLWSTQGVEAANARALPGARPVTVATEAAKGEAQWRSMFGSITQRIADRLLGAITGG